jgi:hypothetical protein
MVQPGPDALSYLEVNHVVHKAKGQQTSPIDGERKGILTRVDLGNVRFDGLFRRSQWATLKAKPGVSLITIRALLGATLDLPGLDGELPPVGTIIPVALLKGRSGVKRNGAQMDAHLATIKATRDADKADAKRYRQIKASIK